MTDHQSASFSPLLSRRTVLGSGAAAIAVAGATVPQFAAQAQVRIDITKGQVQPMPIAVSPFSGAQPQDLRVGQDMTNVIASNLERSGLFKPIDSKAYIQTAAALRTQPPRFPDWRAINAQVLIHGNTEALGDGRMRTEFRLWDVLGEQQMAGRVYTTSAAELAPGRRTSSRMRSTSASPARTAISTRASSTSPSQGRRSGA